MGGTSVGGAAVLTAGHIGSAKLVLPTCQIMLERTRREAFSQWSCSHLVCRGSLLKSDNRATIFREEVGDRPLFNSNPNHLKAFAVCCLRENKTDQMPSSSSMKTSSTMTGSTATFRSSSSSYAPFIVRTYEHRSKEKGWANSDGGTTKHDPLPGSCQMKLWQAMTATSAAPLACSRVDVTIDNQTKRLADGGCVSNSPIAIAIHEANTLWPNRKIGIILSMGLDQDHEVALNEKAVEMARKRNPHLKFVRLRPPLDDFTSYETNPMQIDQMMEVARQYIRNSPEAKEILDEILATPSRRPMWMQRRGAKSGWLRRHSSKRHPLRTAMKQLEQHEKSEALSRCTSGGSSNTFSLLRQISLFSIKSN